MAARTTAAEFFARFRINVQNLRRGFREAQQQAEQTAQNIRRRFNEITRDTRNPFADWARDANRANDAVRGLTNTIRTLVAAYAGKRLFEETLGRAIDIEQIQVRYERLLGTAEAAHQRIASIRSLVRTGLFDLDDIVAADRELERLGIRTERIFRLVGEVAAGEGRALTEVVNLIGQLASGDMTQAILQLERLGIVTREALEQRGVRFDPQGRIVSDAQETFRAVVQAMEDAYSGSMERMSRTVGGILDQLRGRVVDFLAGVGDRALDGLRSGLDSLLGVIDRLEETGQLQQWVQSIGDSLGRVLAGIGAVFEYIANNGPEIIQIIRTLAAATLAYYGTLRAFAALGQIIQLFQRMRAAFIAVSTAARGTTGTLRGLWAAMKALETSTLVGLLASIVAGLAAVAMQSERVRNALSNLLRSAENAFNRWANFVENRLGVIGKMVSWLLRALARVSGAAADMASGEGWPSSETWEQPPMEESPAADTGMPDIPIPSTPAASGPSKTLLDILRERFDPRIQRARLEAEIALQERELAGYGEGTALWEQTRREGLERIRQQILAYINAIREALPRMSGALREQAELRMLELQREANDLLKQIRDNTGRLGEFGLPAGVRATTLYETRVRQAGAAGVTFANNQFVVQLARLPRNESEAREGAERLYVAFAERFMADVVRL